MFEIVKSILAVDIFFIYNLHDVLWANNIVNVELRKIYWNLTKIKWTWNLAFWYF